MRKLVRGNQWLRKSELSAGYAVLFCAITLLLAVVKRFVAVAFDVEAARLTVLHYTQLLSITLALLCCVGFAVFAMVWLVTSLLNKSA